MYFGSQSDNTVKSVARDYDARMVDNNIKHINVTTFVSVIASNPNRGVNVFKGCSSEIIVLGEVSSLRYLYRNDSLCPAVHYRVWVSPQEPFVCLCVQAEIEKVWVDVFCIVGNQSLLIRPRMAGQIEQQITVLVNFM